MSSPKPLEEFRQQLLESKEIQSLVAKRYRADAAQRMKQFQAGDLGDLLSLIEARKYRLSKYPSDTIEAAEPGGNDFEIEIWKVGPVFCIRAEGYDDIGYFSTEVDARRHASIKFEACIAAIEERRDGEAALLAKCLTEGRCPICSRPSSKCNHLLADLDMTFGSFDAGALQDVYAEIAEIRYEDDPDADSSDLLREIHDFLQEWADISFSSDGSESTGRPGSDSQNVWFWAKDVPAIEASVRREFLGAD